MDQLGLMLVVVGAVAGIAGDWMILLRAFRCGAPWFFACLALPFGIWLFAVLSMPRPAVPLTLSFGGLLLAVAGFCLLGTSG